MYRLTYFIIRLHSFVCLFMIFKLLLWRNYVDDTFFEFHAIVFNHSIFYNIEFYVWFITKYRYDNFFAPSSRRIRSGSAQEHSVSTAACRDEVKRLELNVVSVWSRSVFRSRLLFIFRVLTSEKLLVRLLSRTDQSYESIEIQLDDSRVRQELLM